MTTTEILWNARFETELDVLDCDNSELEQELNALDLMSEFEIMQEYNVDSKQEARECIIDFYK